MRIIRACMPLVIAIALAFLFYIFWQSWPKQAIELLNSLPHEIIASAPEETANQTNSKLKLEALGQFGDLFGGLNVLVGSFALIGVGLAAWYQAMANKSMQRQINHSEFEPAFFHTLDLVRSLQAEAEFENFPGLSQGALKITDRSVTKALGMALRQKNADIAKVYYLLLYKQEQLKPLVNIYGQLLTSVCDAAIHEKLRSRYKEIALGILRDEVLLIMIIQFSKKDRKDFAVALLNLIGEKSSVRNRLSMVFPLGLGTALDMLATRVKTLNI